MIAKLGANGVSQVVESPLTSVELEGLREAAVAVSEKMNDLDQIRSEE